MLGPEPEPDVLSYDNASEPELDMISYDSATFGIHQNQTCLAMTMLQNQNLQCASYDIAIVGSRLPV